MRGGPPVRKSERVQPDERERITLCDLLWSAPGHRDALFLPELGARVSYATLRDQVEAAAAALARAGIGRSDRVAIALPNGLPMIVCVLAAATAGTAAPLNPRYRAEEFRFYLDDARARVLIVPPSGAEEAQRAAGDGVRVLVVDVEANGRVSLDAGGPARRVDPPAASDIALLLHTSGCTGTPKRVALSHASLAQSARNVARTYELGPDDVSLCVMPLFHVHGFVASLLATLASGGLAVVPSRFNALSFWQTAREAGATWYSAVPTVHQVLLKRAGDTGRPAGVQPLRFIRSCSAPLAPRVMGDLESAFGSPVLEAYGMTEAAHQVASNPLPPGTRKPGSVGRATAVRIAVVDADGRHVAPGVCGEVVLRGDTVITRYEGRSDANATAFVDGWFRTGDLGCLDDAGYLTLVGRLSEMINRGGEKIAPRDVDEVLLTHPAVAEAVSFGVPHATWGEEVAAVVVLSAAVSAGELLAFCRERLADFKCPREIHISDAIPRGATGKVQRRTLAQQLARAAG